ncbi:hypothetical protein ACIPJN_36945 [Streptomyces sp. NPDC086796]|uniref:hypothetical protein n=1 Tax=Streptomyces sp. NPDC086796 TaxID=3365760 RepID=UPI003821098B
MTAIQHLSSTDSRSRALRARRHTTRVLHLVGDHIGTVALGAVGVAVVARIVNDIVEFAPVLNVTDGVAVLLVLAVWGAARLVEGFAYDIADRVDPDSRDGDDLWDVTTALRANVEDITNGADYDEIRLALQTSKTLPALYELTVQLRNAYAQDGEMEEASALSDTAALVRAAAESLGHRDIGQ